MDDLYLQQNRLEDERSVWVRSYTYYIVFESDLKSGKVKHIYPYLPEDEALQLYMSFITPNSDSLPTEKNIEEN